MGYFGTSTASSKEKQVRICWVSTVNQELRIKKPEKKKEWINRNKKNKWLQKSRLQTNLKTFIFSHMLPWDEVQSYSAKQFKSHSGTMDFLVLSISSGYQQSQDDLLSACNLYSNSYILDPIRTLFQ